MESLVATGFVAKQRMKGFLSIEPLFRRIS